MIGLIVVKIGKHSSFICNTNGVIMIALSPLLVPMTLLHCALGETEVENPLLVTYNRYFNTPLGIRNLANLRINLIAFFIKCKSKSVKRIVRASTAFW